MTHEDLMSKEVISVSDIQAAFGVSYDYAARFIRGVRKYSDLLGIRGKIARQDYIAYMTREARHENA